MQIFAFTECSKFQGLLEVECKEATGERPIITKTLDELKSLIDLFPTIDILIIDSPNDLMSHSDVKNFLVEHAETIQKTMVIGFKWESSDKIQSFSRMEMARLFDELKAFCHSSSSPSIDWTAVPLSTLIHFQSLPFDLFIKLSDQRYVKRIPAYEEMGKDLILNLTVKGIEELYCEKKHNRDFSMMLINNMINKIDRTYESMTEKLHANDEVLETTREIIQSLGLSGRIIEVCETTVERMYQDVLENPDEFSSHLLELKDDKGLSFQYKLVSLTNYLGTQLIQNMNLPHFEEQVKTFIFSSFFCDMNLKDPRLLTIRHNDDIQLLTAKEHDEVKYHALNASKLAASYKNVPDEVSLIIQQHHGRFDGIGFSLEKPSQLLPLAKVLIIAQDLAFTIMNESGETTLETIRRFLLANDSEGLQKILKI